MTYTDLEGGREGEKEGGREEGGRGVGREGGREGRREGGRDGGREGGREGGRDQLDHRMVICSAVHGFRIHNASITECVCVPTMYVRVHCTFQPLLLFSLLRLLVNYN